MRNFGAYASEKEVILLLSYDAAYTYPDMIINIGTAIPTQNGNSIRVRSASVHGKWVMITNITHIPFMLSKIGILFATVKNLQRLIA